mgnify:CR=1 FL=1
MTEQQEINDEFNDEDLETSPQYQRFNLFRNNKSLKRPNCVREGNVKFYNNTDYCSIIENGLPNKPYLCLKIRNKYVWRELSEISGAKFNFNKECIADSLEEMYMKLRMMENSHNITKRKLRKARQIKDVMVIDMINCMDMGAQIAFYTKYPKMREKLQKYKCDVCDKLSANQFKKCRHNDCTSMCESCYHTWQSGTSINENGIFVFGHMSCKSECPACKKSQNYECPICYDEKSKDDMMFSDNCDHFICKNCFCNSFKSNPIVDCPMCRKQFQDTLAKTNYNDGGIEDTITV